MRRRRWRGSRRESRHGSHLGHGQEALSGLRRAPGAGGAGQGADPRRSGVGQRRPPATAGRCCDLYTRGPVHGAPITECLRSRSGAKPLSTHLAAGLGTIPPFRPEGAREPRRYGAGARRAPSRLRTDRTCRGPGVAVGGHGRARLRRASCVRTDLAPLFNDTRNMAPPGPRRAFRTKGAAARDTPSQAPARRGAAERSTARLRRRGPQRA